jgi:hypothetical protein
MDTHKASLLLIHNDPVLVGRVLQEYFDVANEHADATARLYQPCYTKDGKTTADIAQAAIDGLAKSLNNSALNISTPISWQQIYQFL